MEDKELQDRRDALNGQINRASFRASEAESAGNEKLAEELWKTVEELGRRLSDIDKRA